MLQICEYSIIIKLMRGGVKMKIGDKIKQRRLELGYTVEQVADLLGKNRATVYRYENNEIENFPTTILEPLAKVLNTTPAHLMGWEEKHNKNDKAANEAHKIEKGVRIPVLGKVAAGIPIEAIENYNTDEWEEIPEEMASKAEYFALKIQGESMEPKFSDGDVVIVRKQDDLESGEIGVVIINGSDATVKKVMKQDNGILLVASNQSVYPPKFYDNKTINSLPVKILGKVVELRAKF